MSGTGGRNPKDDPGDASQQPRPSGTGEKTARARAKAGRKPPTLTELRDALADRDRQLRDLTEQALDLLDRLAEAQRHDAEHRATAQRADELARLLEDARRRVRTAGGTVLRDGSDPLVAPEVDFVLWGGDAESVRARLDGLTGASALTWVGPGEQLPAWAGIDDRVRWVTADDARTPAQCWNLAMAATTADVVFFLGPAASLADAPTMPAIASDPSVALGQPTCVRDSGEHLGLREERNLTRLVPALTPVPPTTPGDVPFADPEAFVVHRRAFETVGMFDEALLGNLALADYALRAQARGFRTLGLPTLRVEIEAPAPSERGLTPDVHTARDRLLVLASHRPAALGSALAEETTLWELAPGSAAPFVTDLFARLPEGAPVKASMAAILGAMVASAAPATKVITCLHELLAAQVQAWASPPLPEAAGELAALIARVDAAPPGSIAEALAALDAVLVFERRWMPQLAGAMLDAARQRAEEQQRTTQLERELDGARREVAAQLESLQLLAHAIDMVGHVEPARIRERLLDLRQDAEHLASLLAAADAPNPTALIEELYRIRTQLAAGREAIAEREAELAAHRRELAERDRELAERDHEITERNAMIAERDRRLAESEARVAELTATLGARASELHSLERLLGERARWITALLAEVGKRRLRPRKLLDHELAFLAEQDPAR